MLDNLFWSILANLLYGGMTWATAKAYMLANYIPAADQTAAGVIMEANKTGGAGIVAQGAIAPRSRTQAAAPWYVQGAPFEASLPNTAGILPNISAAAGDVLGTDGVTLAWGAASSGGIASFGAVGSAPSANGATVAGTVATLQPADATHPGLMTALTQVLAGDKRFSGDLAQGDGSAKGFLQSIVHGSDGALYIGSAAWAPGSGNWQFAMYGTDFYINGPTSMNLRVGGSDKAVLGTTSFDFTGLGNGGTLKLKSPDGTTYTLSVANGGTWSIV